LANTPNPVPRLNPFVTRTHTVGSPSSSPPTKAQNPMPMLLLMIVEATTGSSSLGDSA